jgi:hypothetical protein
LYDINLPEKVSWSAFVEVPKFEDIKAAKSSPAVTISQPNLFITATDDMKEGIVEDDESYYSEPPDRILEDSMTFQVPKIQSTSSVLRNNLNYKKIFSATKLVEKDSNRRVGSTWHPKYDKVMFMLDKTALDEVQLRYHKTI